MLVAVLPIGNVSKTVRGAMSSKHFLGIGLANVTAYEIEGVNQ